MLNEIEFEFEQRVENGLNGLFISFRMALDLVATHWFWLDLTHKNGRDCSIIWC